MCGSRRFYRSRIERQPLEQLDFLRRRQLLEAGIFKVRGPCAPLLWQIRNHFPCVLEDRMTAGMAVLDIEHRIVPGLLDHLGEVEIQHGVVLAE